MTLLIIKLKTKIKNVSSNNIQFDREMLSLVEAVKLPGHGKFVNN